MQPKHHKIIAITLAFLVFFSTTGMSMNVMLCHCTGQQYLALFNPGLSCCKKKATQALEQQAAPHACCSKEKTSACKKTDPHKPSVEADKKCCSSNFKYSKANINLDLVVANPLPIWAITPTVLYSFTPIYYQVLLQPQPVAIIGHPNKAPPKPYGRLLLDLIQIYRC